MAETPQTPGFPNTPVRSPRLPRTSMVVCSRGAVRRKNCSDTAPKTSLVVRGQSSWRRTARPSPCRRSSALSTCHGQAFSTAGPDRVRRSPRNRRVEIVGRHRHARAADHPGRRRRADAGHGGGRAAPRRDRHVASNGKRRTSLFGRGACPLAATSGHCARGGAAPDRQGPPRSSWAAVDVAPSEARGGSHRHARPARRSSDAHAGRRALDADRRRHRLSVVGTAPRRARRPRLEGGARELRQ